jgi:hypothetical protein
VRRGFIAATALSYAAEKLINPVPYTPGRLHELKFKASPGWMNGFLRRSGLVLRRRTNNHRLTRLQRVPFVLRCVWRARQIMQSAPAAGETGDPITGRFRAHDVYNSDQLPLEDEDKDGKSPARHRHHLFALRPKAELPWLHTLAGKTYAPLGATDVNVVQANPSNGGSPRFGSVHLCVHGGDGAQCKPMVIFEGKDSKSIRAAERAQYAPGTVPHTASPHTSA